MRNATADPRAAVTIGGEKDDAFGLLFRGTMTIEGRAFAVEPGTTIYMPAGVEVSYQNGDAELVAIQVFAGPEPAAKYDAWTPAQ